MTVNQLTIDFWLDSGNAVGFTWGDGINSTSGFTTDSAGNFSGTASVVAGDFRNFTSIQGHPFVAASCHGNVALDYPNGSFRAGTCGVALDPGASRRLLDGACGSNGDVVTKTLVTCSPEPVNLATGSYFHTATDAQLAGAGVPFSFTRSYNSGDPSQGSFGQGWASGYETALFDGSGLVGTVAQGQGKAFVQRARKAGGDGSLSVSPCAPPYPEFAWPNTPIISSGCDQALIAAGPVSVGQLAAPKQDQPVLFRGPDGRQMLFRAEQGPSYSAEGGVAAQLAVDPAGFAITTHDQKHYVFDQQGRLLSEKDRNGFGVTLSYQGSKLSTVTDSSGRVVRFSYSGNLLSGFSLPDGRSVSYGYSAGQLTSVTDMRGNTTTYRYNSAGLLEEIDNQNGDRVVENFYDAQGRVIEQVDPLGGHSFYNYDQPGVTTFTDANTRTWTYGFTSNLLTSVTDPLGNKTFYQRDADANVTQVTDARLNSWTMEYDSSDNLTSRTSPAPQLNLERWTYDAFSNPTSYQDPKGNITTYRYNLRGDLQRITQPGPSGPIVTFIDRSLPSGQPLSLIVDLGGLNRTWHFGYDAQNNLSSVASPSGNLTTFGYDSSGRLTSMVDPRGNEPGARPGDFTWIYGYNAADQPNLAIDPLGDRSSSSHDPAGNLQTVTDPRGNTTTYGYDAGNHLTSTLMPGGIATSATFDSIGNILTSTDANSNQTSYSYDSLNRPTQTLSALGQQWNYHYDAAGNLDQKIDANRTTTTSSYNTQNQLTSVAYSDGVTPSVSYTYDANGTRKTMTDGAGLQTYNYDSLNRLTDVTRGADTFSYQYDAVNFITKRTYPDGTVTNYTPDQNGQMKTAETGGQTTTYHYNSAGMLSRTDMPNGVSSRTTYDAAGRTTEVANAGPSGVISDFAYTLDPAGNPSFITGPGGTSAYQYDALNRLTQVCSSACPNPSDFTQFSYDGVGNRLSMQNASGTTTYSYNAGNEMTSIASPSETTAISYDANGNETSAPGQVAQMTYDAAGNRLTEVHRGIHQAYTADYSYDGDGNRIAIHETFRDPNTPTQQSFGSYQWDTNNVLPQLAIEKAGPSSSSLSEFANYAYGQGLISEQQAGQSHYYSTDRMGSVSNITDSQGNPETSYSYGPFGETTRTDQSATAPSNSFAYTGQYWDGARNLGGRGFIDQYNMRARSYSPQEGRFLQPDPFGAGYAYVYDNPIVYSDPAGLFSWGGLFSTISTIASVVAIAAVVVAAVAAAPEVIAGALVVEGIAEAVSVTSSVASTAVYCSQSGPTSEPCIASGVSTGVNIATLGLGEAPITQASAGVAGAAVGALYSWAAGQRAQAAVLNQRPGERGGQQVGRASK